MMKCPLCNKYMMLVGSDAGIGWDCEKKARIPYKHGLTGEIWHISTPHYSVRGARADTIIFPYKIETWEVATESPGVSTVYHHKSAKDDGTKYSWEKLFSCPSLPIADEAKLLERLKLLTVFS